MNKNSAQGRRRNPRSEPRSVRSQSRRLRPQNPALTTHKYEVGQTVFLTPRMIGTRNADQTYRVVQLLPSDGDDYQYRIKSATEAFERVAKESQLEHG